MPVHYMVVERMATNPTQFHIDGLIGYAHIDL